MEQVTAGGINIYTVETGFLRSYSGTGKFTDDFLNLRAG